MVAIRGTELVSHGDLEGILQVIRVMGHTEGLGEVIKVVQQGLAIWSEFLVLIARYMFCKERKRKKNIFSCYEILTIVH